MNKIINNKLTVGIAVLTMLISGTAFAASLNTHSQDYPTLQIVNYTKYYTNNSNNNVPWASSAVADPGDIVTFKFFYHNNASDTATDVRFRLDLPATSFASQAITGQVWAQNASAALGNVRLDITSAQTISLYNVIWYKYSTQTALPNSQTGNEVTTTNGLTIGDVAANESGYVLVRARISGSNGNGATVSTNDISASAISPNSAILTGTVDTTKVSADTWFSYGTASNPSADGSLGNTTARVRKGLSANPVEFDAVIANLSPNTTYFYRAFSQDTSDSIIKYGSIKSFITSAGQGGISNPAPIVLTNTATSVASTSAILNGTINPNYSYSEYWFEYGTSTSLGYTTEHRNVGNFSSPLAVNVYIENLSVNAQYYFRIVGKNIYGTNYGNTITFATGQNSTVITTNGTLPKTITNSALYIKDNSALLNATITPNGSITNAWFEWSEDPNMINGVNRNNGQSMGQGYADTYASYALANLVLGKTYYFRTVAQNSYGTNYGTVRNFTTTASAATNGGATSGNTVKPVSNDAITLGADFSKNNPRPGSEIVYTINYKNNLNFSLGNAILKVILPNEAGYESSSYANVNSENGVISFKLGNISANDSGSISIKVKITDLTKAEKLKFDTTLGYSSNSQPASVNMVNELELNTSSLTASAVDVLAKALSNLFVDIVLGGLIGAGAYHFVINKKKIAVVDAGDPLA